MQEWGKFDNVIEQNMDPYIHPSLYLQVVNDEVERHEERHQCGEK